MFVSNVGGLWAKPLPMELGKKTLRTKRLTDGEAGNNSPFSETCRVFQSSKKRTSKC